MQFELDETNGTKNWCFLCCWPDSMQQFVVGAENDITDYWTVHVQLAKHLAVCTKLLRIDTVVITVVIRLCKNKMLLLNWTELNW